MQQAGGRAHALLAIESCLHMVTTECVPCRQLCACHSRSAPKHPAQCWYVTLGGAGEGGGGLA